MFGKKKKVDAKPTEQKGVENAVDDRITKVKSGGEFPYYVVIYDVTGSMTQENTRFPVQRLIEKGNVYLFNKDRGFKEPFPSNSDDFKQWTIEDLEIEHNNLQQKLEKALKTNTNDSIKQLKKDTRTIRNYIRSLEMQGEGSFMQLDKEGKLYFEFIRKDNFKIPIFFNTDLSTKYFPSEAKIKSASSIVREIDEQYGDKNQLKLVNYALTFLLVLGVLGIFYYFYKLASAPAVFAEHMNLIVDNFRIAAEAFRDASTNLDIVTNSTVNNTPTAIPQITNVK